MKKLGIYMEYKSANLIEFTLDLLKVKFVNSSFNLFKHKELNHQDINHIEYKEPYSQKDYFKKLSESILYYNEVLLFGKLQVAKELFDSIADDNRFYNIKIIIKKTHKMTYNQQNDFVSNYFLLENL